MVWAVVEIGKKLVSAFQRIVWPNLLTFLVLVVL